MNMELIESVQSKREYKFSAHEFNELRHLIKDLVGIDLGDGKADMVYSRLSRRLKLLGLRSFDEYIHMLKDDPDGDEVSNFVNQMSTNLTSFFREMHHFEYLQQTLLPRLMREKVVSQRIRIWSAGCSSGEEPYSLAMIVAESVPPGWDVKILATDMDSNMIDTAKAGVYEVARIEGLDEVRAKRWFARGSGVNAGKVRVKEQLREMITFKRLNLMQQWPMKGPFDIIFCRNVIIYFDNETKATLIDRYVDFLPEGGSLFVGHSETLFGVTKRLRLVGKTVYEKL